MVRALAVCLLLAPVFAHADAGPRWVGGRATGLAGAFTAVADDATAFHWNPAGIVHGSLIRGGFYGGSSFHDRNELVDRLRSGRPGEDSVLDGGPSFGFSTSFTALGVAVTRFTETETLLDGESILTSRGLETLDFAVTFVQSLPVDVLTVGANVHVVRGTAFEERRSASEVPESERNVRDLIDAATSSEGVKETEFALDAGVLYQPRDWIRLGLMVSHLVEPSFTTRNGDELVQNRHARAGLALMKDPGWLASVDFDLTSRASRTINAGPTWRELSAGAEKIWGNRRVALRGGVRTEIESGTMHHPGFSVGVGVRIAQLTVDVGAITSTKRRLGGVWVGLSFTQ